LLAVYLHDLLSLCSLVRSQELLPVRGGLLVILPAENVLVSTTGHQESQYLFAAQGKGICLVQPLNKGLVAQATGLPLNKLAIEI
jgi:hypothetical protein